MRRLLLSVMAGALGWALLAPTAAFAKFNHGNIAGTYVSTFQLNLNDQASAGVYVTSSGLQQVVHQIGKNVGNGTKQCPTLSLPKGITTTDIKTVAGSIIFGPGDIMSGVMQTTYDGNGSVVGEADFNIFRDAAYAKTKSLQALNGVNSGFTSRICGGMAAQTEDAQRCGPVCTITDPNKAPYNCALTYPGSSGSLPNQGGGGYTTSADATIFTNTSATPNDVSSIQVLHFYISAFGLCAAGVNSFAQCCNDPALDMIMHIPTVNSPATGNVEQSFGVVGDPWASGIVNSVFSGTPTP